MHSNSVSKFNFFSELLYGSLIPFRALDLIFSNRRLLVFSLLPVFLGVLVLGVLLFFLISGLQAWAAATFAAWMSGFSGALIGLGVVLVSLAAAIFGIQSLGFLVSLVSSPLNDILAESTERVLHVPHAETTFAQMVRVFVIDLRKTLICLVALAILSIGMLIPILNIGFFLGIALLNTFTYISYPLTRREQGIKNSIQWIRHNFGASLGFGIVTTLLLLAPVLNIFILPVAVVGGTLLFLRK